jgi:acyl-CoA synthetase (AMP-forming)/AMP-acid ligase II
MLVQDFLQNSAARWPDKVALICGSERYTYAQLDAMANRLANALREQGVQRGDRVGIYLYNSVQSVVAVFGALKADAVFVAVNRAIKPDKLLFILNNCQAASTFADRCPFPARHCGLWRHDKARTQWRSRLLGFCLDSDKFSFGAASETKH